MSEVLPPGTEIGNYRIEQVVGQGGMGVVYLAEHLHLGRRAALKTISGVYAQDPQFRERFVRESRVAARIDHPHIVPIYDAGEAEGLLYLAMRLVKGQDLDDLIRQQTPLDTALILQTIGQIASALDAAHAEGLVHRDVKPANVLLEWSGTGGVHAYLVDFGLTKHAGAASGLTAPGQVMGTPFYVAPEQIDGKELDGRADQYSLACVLFECLTGSPPFAPDGELLAILSAHAHHSRPRLTDQRPDLPAAIDDVIVRGLATDPQQRFANCGELMTGVADALAGQEGAGPEAAGAVGAAGAARPGHTPPPEELADDSVSPASNALAPDHGPTEAGAADEAGAEAQRDEAGGAHPGTAGDGTGQHPGAASDVPAARAGSPPTEPGVGRDAPTGQRAEPPSGPAEPPSPSGPAEPPPPGPSEPTPDEEVPQRSRLTVALLSGAVLALVAAGAMLALALVDGTGPSTADDGGQEPGAGEDAGGGQGGDSGQGGEATPPVPGLPSERVLFTSDRSGDNDVHIVRPDGSGLANLTEDSDADDRQARWSPDRDRVVFASDRTGDFAIFTMNPDGSDVTQVADEEGRDDLDPVFSRDGQSIAFSSQRDGDATRSIYVVDVDGSQVQRVTGDGGSDQRPTWSPDQQLLAFQRAHQDGVMDIFVHNIDAGPEQAPINVTQRRARDFHPSWSSQMGGQSQLVFATNHAGNQNVVTLDVIDVLQNGDSDTVPLPVTEDPAADFDPTWHPDDEWIAFESQRDGNSEVYLVRRDRSQLQRLTEDPATDVDPGW